jgi:hypothetical protein
VLESSPVPGPGVLGMANTEGLRLRRLRHCGLECMLQKLCQHMGVNVDSSKQEVQSFSKTTDVRKLASELEDKLPEE